MPFSSGILWLGLFLCFFPSEGFCGNLPPRAIIPLEPVSWGDKRHEPGWKYFEESDPGIKARWDSYAPREQLRLVSLAKGKGIARLGEVTEKYQAGLDPCGTIRNPERRNPPEGPGGIGCSCNLEPLLKLAEKDFKTFRLWMGEKGEKDIRERKKEALRFRDNLKKGSFATEDVIWAKVFLPGACSQPVEQLASLRSRLANMLPGKRPERAKQILMLEGLFKDPGLSYSRIDRMFTGSRTAVNALTAPAARLSGHGGAPSVPSKAGIQNQRSKLLSGVGPPPALSSGAGQKIDFLIFKNPEEKRLSRVWNESLKKQLKKNRVGKELLDYLGPELPSLTVREASEGALATYLEGTWNIKVDPSNLRHEICSYDRKAGVCPTLDDMLAGKTPPTESELARYLLKNPSVREKVFQSYGNTLVHELVHAAQEKGFPSHHVKSDIRTNPIEVEQHAFSVQHEYALEEMKKDPSYLSSTSFVSRNERSRLQDCLRSYDQCMRDVTVLYGSPSLSDLTSENRKDAPAAGFYSRMKNFYDRFFSQERRKWREKRTEGLLLLAQRQAQEEPDEALENLILIKTSARSDRTAPSFDRKVEQALKTVLDGYSAEVKENVKGGYHSYALIYLEKLEKAYGRLRRPFPKDLEQIREVKYRREIEELKSYIEDASSPDKTLEMAKEGLYYAVKIKDKASIAFFQEKLRKLGRQ